MSDAETNGTATSNPFDFDAREKTSLQPKEIRGIMWQGKEHVLKRASEGANAEYVDEKIKQARMNDGKLVGLAGGGKLPSLLVSRCLHRIVLRPDGTEAYQPISQKALLEQWPPEYVQELFEAAKRISAIDQPPKKSKAEQIRELRAKLAELEGHPPGEGETERLVHIDLTAGTSKNADEETPEDEVGNLSSAIAATSA